MGNATKADYKEIAKQSRLKALELIYAAKTSHVGSNFSCADIMAVLFEHINLDEDKFILSKGWAAAMLYYHLWRRGRMTLEELNSYCLEVICEQCNGKGTWGYDQEELICNTCGGKGKVQSKYIGLAEPVHPDIPFAGGSMGMGLAAGVGLAWSKKQRGEPGTVYVLESDGGTQVGITWEALWFAAQHRLTNLFLIVDKNNFQAMNKTWNILSLDDPGTEIQRKLMAFGWNVGTIDGHNFSEIDEILTIRSSKHPTVVVANTIKGKGVSFMENNNLWHYAQVKEGDYIKAKAELENA